MKSRWNLESHYGLVPHKNRFDETGKISTEFLPLGNQTTLTTGVFFCYPLGLTLMNMEQESSHPNFTEEKNDDS